MAEEPEVLWGWRWLHNIPGGVTGWGQARDPNALISQSDHRPVLVPTHTLSHPSSCSRSLKTLASAMLSTHGCCAAAFHAAALGLHPPSIPEGRFHSLPSFKKIGICF